MAIKQPKSYWHDINRYSTAIMQDVELQPIPLSRWTRIDTWKCDWKSEELQGTASHEKSTLQQLGFITIVWPNRFCVRDADGIGRAVVYNTLKKAIHRSYILPAQEPPRVEDFTPESAAEYLSSMRAELRADDTTQKEHGIWTPIQDDYDFLWQGLREGWQLVDQIPKDPYTN